METAITVKDPTHSTIRIELKTRKALDRHLSLLNKKELGRKLTLDEVIFFSLALIEDKHLETLRERTLSNEDRLELKFREAKKENPKLSREEWLSNILSKI